MTLYSKTRHNIFKNFSLKSQKCKIIDMLNRPIISYVDMSLRLPDNKNKVKKKKINKSSNK